MLNLLAHEFLTPAAQDLAERKHLTVNRAQVALPVAGVQASPLPATAPSSAASAPTATLNATAPTAAASPAAAPASPAVTAVSPVVAGPAAVGIVVERADTKVQTLLASLQQDRTSLLSYNQTDCWIRNLRALAAAIAAGQVGAGVMVMPYGADAMLLAGKLPGIRPVQGTTQASVAAAVRHYGANLLVLEHAFCTLHQMRSMVRELTGPRSAPIAAGVLAAVAQLEGR